MAILTDLSWCHKFQLHFMSLMHQIKGTFIKIYTSGDLIFYLVL